MTQFSRLFEPGKIGRMELKNRLIMAAMGNKTADSNGFITHQSIDYYVARAKGGVGLLITQCMMCVSDARAPGRPFIDDDRYVPRLARLAEAIHAGGAKTAIQLNYHGMARMSTIRSKAEHPEQIALIGPSAIPLPLTGEIPREATTQDIEHIVNAFAEGARRVRDAGFDAVEFHGAHGTMISSFLSPRTNRRTDEYGGNTEKRARFACEIIARTRQKVGPDFPIIFRLSGSDYLEGGINIGEVVRQAPLLVRAGADALHVSASVQETAVWQHLSYLWPSGDITNLAQEVKKTVTVPVITVGKLSDPAIAARVLEEGKADFIAIARGLLADPDLADKMREGRLDDIKKCLYCNNCHTGAGSHKVVGRGFGCTVNPELFREADFKLRPAATARKVMVIGGGLAGMEAARALAERGHDVSLYERDKKLGGQWNLACRQEGKEDFASLTERLARGIKESGVKVVLNTLVTTELVDQSDPEVIIVATGAKPATLNIPGADSKKVVQAVDVIAGNAKVGSTVVVIGGRYIGMEIALALAKQGKKVSLVTRRGLGRDVEGNIFRTLRQMLAEQHVPVCPDSPVLEVTSEGVTAVQDNHLLFLKADTVILAVGYQAESKLAEDLKRSRPNVYQIGDCVEPRNAMEAMYEGRSVACEI